MTRRLVQFRFQAKRLDFSGNMNKVLLDEVVWMEIVRLLEDPQLIQIELDRRLQAAQRADPTKRREDALRRNLLRIRKSIERLLTAYQEGLISLDELRQRMPDLRMREQTDQAELQAIADQSAERTACLRLAETVTDFLARLRSSAGTLDLSERQRILRLLVKDILVGDDKIVIRHSIPLPTNPSGGHPPKTDSPGPSPTQSESYLLRSGRNFAAPRQYLPALLPRCLGQALATARSHRRHDHRAIRR